MNANASVVFMVAMALSPATVSANVEPVSYDTRSVALGWTGVSYLDSPAALAINPALLEGVEHAEILLHATPYLLRAQSPLQGPGSSTDSELGVAPVSSFFVAGRIAPRVVFGAGLYLEVAFGGEYKDVTMIDGEPSNTTPEDLELSLFTGDASFGFSFRVSKKVNIGAALRLPFARLSADVYQNFLAALGSGLVGYAQVKTTMAGVGVPGVRLGVSYEPIPRLSLGIGYRSSAKIPLHGTAEAAGLPLPGLDDQLLAQSSWSLPHALQFGLTVRFLNRRLRVILEERLQFHNAKRSGNDELRIDVDVPADVQPVVGAESVGLVVPLDWKLVHVTKVGVEYEVSKLLDIRAGTNLGSTSTTERFAIFISPPPGFYWLATIGVGLNWDAISLDLGAVVGSTKATVDPSVAASGPVTYNGETFDLCSSDQVVRSGCAGQYKLLLYGGSATITFRFRKPTKKQIAAVSGDPVTHADGIGIPR